MLQVTRYSYRIEKALVLKPMWSGYLGAKKCSWKPVGFQHGECWPQDPQDSSLYNSTSLHMSAGESWSVNRVSQLGIAHASATQKSLRTISREASTERVPGCEQTNMLKLPSTQRRRLVKPVSGQRRVPGGACQERVSMAHLDVLARRTQCPWLQEHHCQGWLHLQVGLSNTVF